MKAAVLKVRGKEAIVLLEDGTMRKIKCNAERGDEIELPDIIVQATSVAKEKKSFPKRRFLQAAVAAAMTAFLLTGAWTSVSVLACTYVTLDAELSVELVLNSKDELIGAEALNEGAEEVANRLMEHGPRQMNYSDALSLTEEVMDENGYLSSEEELLVSIVTDTDDRYEKLTKETEEVTARNEHGRLRLGHATHDDRKKAKKEGISTGKYMHRHRPSDMIPIDPHSPAPKKPDEKPAQEKPRDPVPMPKDGKQPPEKK